MAQTIANASRVLLAGRGTLRALVPLGRTLLSAWVVLHAGAGWLQAESLWSKLGVASEADSFSAASVLLQRSHTPPQSPGESNHFLDLWPGPKTADLARGCGLTNNHALIVNSHGRSVSTLRGARYRYYPHDALLAPGQKVPYFSAADLARVVGIENIPNIHNILIAGCNEGGGFSAKELRKWFVNATNITHMAEGERGYQPMFFQALTLASAEIEPLYETSASTAGGKAEFQIGRDPVRGAIRFSPYVAELFLPGAKTPFHTGVAGRELLDPSLAGLAAVAARPPARPFTTAQLSSSNPR